MADRDDGFLDGPSGTDKPNFVIGYSKSVGMSSHPRPEKRNERLRWIFLDPDSIASEAVSEIRGEKKDGKRVLRRRARRKKRESLFAERRKKQYLTRRLRRKRA